VARSVRGGGRLDTGLLVTCLLLSVVCVVMPQRFRDSVSAALRQTVLFPLVVLEGKATGVRATISARDELLATRAQAITDTLSLRAVTDENTTLRRLLGLSARLGVGITDG